MKAVLLGLLLTVPLALSAHEATPDPILFYNFTRQHLVLPAPPPPPPDPPASPDEPVEEHAVATAARLKSQFGPELVLGVLPIEEEGDTRGLRFAAAPVPHRLDTKPENIADHRPVKDFTLSTWFTVDTPQPYGALISCIADDGGLESGLALGYRDTRPMVALATRGADDGDGKLTYLTAEKRLTPGRWHHLAATYDGAELRLFLDGEQVASTLEQSGEILWPLNPETWVGGFKDSNENFPHHGRIGDIKVFGICANAGWVAKEFERGSSYRDLPGEQPPGAEPAVIVEPYLQWVRARQATVMWETNYPCKGTLMWGKTPDCPNVVVAEKESHIQQITLTGLEPEMLYYFKTTSPFPGGSNETKLQTFQTAMKPGSPFGFVVFCDTQANPDKLKRLSEAAWELRPNFVMIGGDLVTTGSDKSHWTEHFFPHMRPLIDSVPFYPVIGNHEQNSVHYYDYVKLPAPEYFYTFKQGDIQFFMLDSNKDLRPGSEQFLWLDRQLAASKSLWKICMHHHPPFSSDDDYGNDWKHPVEEMTLGEPATKSIVELYDRHGVDIVWNGHIHSYERTWMIRGGKPVKKNGTTYLITGGAGGGLESFGPYRPAFQRHIKTGHHFTYVTAFGGHLDMKAYDIEGRLFDHFTFDKKEKPRK
jgi:acid phosphatase type 7